MNPRRLGLLRRTGKQLEPLMMRGMWMQLIALCSGASAGAIARWQLSLWLNDYPNNAIPWGTWVANALGAYLIGLVVSLLQSNPQIDPVWRLVLVTGFLGALTTFSTFSIETLDLLQAGKAGWAITNAALNLGGSLMLTWLGVLSAQWWLGAQRIS